jgi:hypothetical protein
LCAFVFLGCIFRKKIVRNEKSKKVLTVWFLR